MSIIMFVFYMNSKFIIFADSPKRSVNTEQKAPQMFVNLVNNVEDPYDPAREPEVQLVWVGSLQYDKSNEPHPAWLVRTSDLLRSRSAISVRWISMCFSGSAGTR